MPYGIINYNSEKYIFNLDKAVLCIEKLEDINGTYIYPDWLINPPCFSDEYIEGINVENGKIILFKPCPGNAGFKNTKIYIRIQYYIELNRKSSINMISFECAELNYFYDISNCIEEYNFSAEGQASCRTKCFEDTTSEKESFILNGEEVDIHFAIYRGIIPRSCSPLNLRTIANFTFSETNNYDFLIQICRLLQSFMSFVCYRKSIGEYTIELYEKGDEREHEKVGSIYFPGRTIIVETEKIIMDRHLTYDGLKGKIGKIFQDIEDDRLYLRHLPDNYQDSLKIDCSKFIMITAAIEWIFKNTYPKGVIHRSSTIKATENIKNELTIKIEGSSGKQKELYKFLKKVLDSDALSQRIVQIGKDNDELLNEIGKYLYKINNKEDKFAFAQIGNRIESQRNNFAHGNLGKEFDELSILDIMFLERAVYLLQLKEYCTDKAVIIEQVKKLFGMHF